MKECYLRRRRFERRIEDLVCSDKVQRMKNMKHHAGGVSCLEHCLFVSYISFLAAEKLGLDKKTAARGRLLHDLYLDGCRGDSCVKRLFVHPKAALKNAESGFLINDTERDIIASHMWPLTLTKLPRHAESFVVGAADKFCAAREMSGIYARTSTRRRLRSLVAEKTRAC